MPLEKQPISISFNQGVDTKGDKYQVQGKLLTLENGVFVSTNQISKRNGFTNRSLDVFTDATAAALHFSAIPTTLTTGNTLATFKDEQVLMDGFNLYSRIASQDKWAYKGPLTLYKQSTSSVLRNINTQAMADSAQISSGAALFAWEDTNGATYNGVKASVIDSATGANAVFSNSLISATGTLPRCVAIGQRLVLFWYESATHSLKYVSITNGVVSSATTLVTDVDGSNVAYDCAVFNDRIYVAYNSSANTSNQINVTFLTNTLQTGELLELTGQKATNCICVFGDTMGNVWVAFANTTTVKFFVANELLTTNSSTGTVEALGSVHNITGVFRGKTDVTQAQCVLLYDVLGSADSSSHYSNAVVHYALVEGASDLDPIVDGTGIYLRSASLQSKAFGLPFGTDSQGEPTYIPHAYVVHDSALQPTYFLTNLYNYGSDPIANIAGKVAPGLAGASPQAIQTKNLLASVNQSETGVFQTALLERDLFFTASSTSGTTLTLSQSGVVSSVADFTTTNPSTAVLGANLTIGTGNVALYDGANVAEQGFNYFPELVSVATSGAGGLITAGNYAYQVVYTWTDNQGQLHRSAPSPIVSLSTSGATSTNTLTIPTLRATNKTNVGIEVYRTQNNGTVYFRLNQPTGTGGPLANTKSADTVTYVDTKADSAISANQQLYTTGGEVENIAPPASTISCTFKNRVVLVSDDDASTWWFSKQIIPGSPPEFSDLFVKSIGTAYGALTACAQMDSNLLLFTANNILYTQGDGPSSSGQNDDLTEAQQIASDVGCIDARSLVLTPLGLMFQSNKGIYLLGRDMQPKYVGADVEAYNSETITSARLMASVNQVRFSLASGKFLVFDYFVSQWSVFTNLNAVSSVVQNSHHLYLNPTGTVYEETPGTFLDGAAPIKLRLTTSWLSFAGLQGYERVYKALILGHYKGAHQLLVKVAYDFNSSPTQYTYIDAGSVLDVQTYGADATYGTSTPYGGNYPLYQWRLNFTRQKCQSIQLTLEDVAELPYNEALSLSAIGLEVGLKKGLNKRPANRSFGV